jgi:hypothetical protein
MLKKTLVYTGVALVGFLGLAAIFGRITSHPKMS